VNLQTLEQAIAQKASGSIQAFGGFLRLARDEAEKHFGVRVIGRDFNRIQSDHAHTRVFELARNQLRQIPLDLVGHAESAMG
jgi:hypothetical protein